jgi:hypothetical protein
MKRVASVHYLSEVRARRNPAVHEARMQALYAIIMADADTWMAEHFPVEGEPCKTQKNT